MGSWYRNTQLSFMKWKVSFIEGKVCNIGRNGAPSTTTVILRDLFERHPKCSKHNF